MSSVATSSKVTLPPKVTPAQQCSTCGYQWPWVVFNNQPIHQNQHLEENICFRCQSPELEAWRWQVLRGEMKKAIHSQRRRYLEEQALKGHPPLIKAANQASGAKDGRIPLKRSRDSSGRIVHPPPLHSIPPPAVTNLYSAAALANLQGGPKPIAPPQPPVIPGRSHTQPTISASASRAPRNGTSGASRPLPPEFQYAIPQDPTAPPLVMPGSLCAVTEPTRAMLWIQMHYYAAPPHLTLPQIQIFNAYRAAFPPPTAADPTYTSAQLHGADLIKLIPKCFPTSRLSGRGYVVEGLQLRPSVDPIVVAVLMEHLSSAQVPDRRQPQSEVVNLSNRQPQPVLLAPQTTARPKATNDIPSGTNAPTQAPRPGPSQPKRIRLEAAPFPMLAETRQSASSTRPSTPSNEPARAPVVQERPSVPQVPVPESAISGPPPSTTRDTSSSQPPPIPPPTEQPEHPIARATFQSNAQPSTPQSSSQAVSGLGVLSSLRKKLIDLSSRSNPSDNGPQPLSGPSTPSTSQKSTLRQTATPSTPQVSQPKPKLVEIISLVDDSDDEEPAAPPAASSNSTPGRTPSVSSRSTGRQTWATANDIPHSRSAIRSAPMSTSSQASQTAEISPLTRIASNTAASDPKASYQATSTGSTISAKSPPHAGRAVSGDVLGPITSHSPDVSYVAGFDSAPRSQTGRSQWDSPPPIDPPESTSQPARESLQATELDSEDEVGAALDEGGAQEWWGEFDTEPR